MPPWCSAVSAPRRGPGPNPVFRHVCTAIPDQGGGGWPFRGDTGPTLAIPARGRTRTRSSVTSVPPDPGFRPSGPAVPSRPLLRVRTDR
eukprot:gene18666-biopygen8415